MAKDWFADEDFWTAVRPAMFSRTRMNRVAGETDAICKLLGLKAGDHVIDACCGFGRYSVELAKKGLILTSFDLCEPFVTELSEIAAASSLSIDSQTADIRTIELPPSHDAALVLYTSLGFFEDPEDDLRALQRLNNGLKPGAPLLVDIYSPARVARERVEACEDEESLAIKFRHLDVNRSRNGWLWANVDWHVLRHGSARCFSFGHRFYTAAGLSSLFRRAGFEKIQVHGSYTGEPYHESSEDLVVTGMKPKD